jgi:hypothetical protein
MWPDDDDISRHPVGERANRVGRSAGNEVDFGAVLRHARTSNHGPYGISGLVARRDLCTSSMRRYQDMNDVHGGSRGLGETMGRVERGIR